MLHKASTRDLLYEVQTKMAEAGLPELPLRARGVLRGVFEEYLTEIQAINEAEAQLSSQLSQLQEESVSMRSRPAEVILRPMQTFVSTEARKLGSSAQFSYVGGECSLDQLVLEEVRGLLKLAISDRLRAKEPPSKFFLAIDREEDRVRVEITDNGKECALSDDFKAASHELTRRKGVMRFVTLPNGGVRLMLEVPLHTIVLEGMVVKIGDVRYVLPIESIQRIHQGSKTVPIKAAGNRRMLVVDDNDYVPIRVLSSARTQVHSSGQQLYVIVRNNASRMAIPVDELLGQQLVLLRPLRGVLSMVPDVTGVAILSGGEIGMVVSVSRIEAAA
jgi:two-component system chemotaxis sensor kinase CheA